MGSRLDSIGTSAAAGRPESLVSCLHAVLRAYGREVDPDELACVTGTAVMTSYAPAADPAARWNVFGRHAFLTAAALHYGLELRDLHPPSAAPEPPAPPEFDWHFRDSYIPFVRSALERDEPVLAWMGWPDRAAHDWGVIRGIDADGTCVGWTPALEARSVRMTAPPIQVYQPIEYSARVPGADELARATLARLGRILRGNLGAGHGARTGPAAIRALQEVVADPQTGTDAGAAAIVVEVLCSFVRGRREAARFLQRLSGPVGDADRRRVDHVMTALERMAATLAPWIEAGALTPALADASAKATITRALESVVVEEDSLAGFLTESR